MTTIQMSHFEFLATAGFRKKSYVVHTTIVHKPENTKCRHKWRIRLYCTDTAKCPHSGNRRLIGGVLILIVKNLFGCSCPRLEVLKSRVWGCVCVEGCRLQKKWGEGSYSLKILSVLTYL